MVKSLRDAIKQKVSADPQSVVKALSSSGVKLTKEETYQITHGKIDQFTDKQLGDRFSPKVLGALGINYETYASSKSYKEKESYEGKYYPKKEGYKPYKEEEKY